MITFVGFSPAWQQVYCVDDLQSGEVIRANSAFSYASGKATNAAIVASRYTRAKICLASLVGGPVGELFARDLERHQIVATLVEAAPTRVCTTVVSSEGRATELIENAQQVEVHAADAMIDAVTAVNPIAIAVSGSLPPGVPDDVYRRLVALTDGPSIVDAAGSCLLESLPAEPTLIKPNLGELAQSTGFELSSDEPPGSQRVLDAMQSLIDRGAQNVLVTNGAEPAVLLTPDGAETVCVPAVERLVNAIGSGDSLTGATLTALASGKPVPDAVAIGLEAAALNCGVLRPEEITMQV